MRAFIIYKHFATHRKSCENDSFESSKSEILQQTLSNGSRWVDNDDDQNVFLCKVEKWKGSCWRCFYLSLVPYLSGKWFFILSKPWKSVQAGMKKRKEKGQREIKVYFMMWRSFILKIMFDESAHFSCLLFVCFFLKHLSMCCVHEQQNQKNFVPL